MTGWRVCPKTDMPRTDRGNEIGSTGRGARSKKYMVFTVLLNDKLAIIHFIKTETSDNEKATLFN